MTLQIALTPEMEAKLRERAAANGKDVASYAAGLLDEAVNAPSVDELLAPFRRQVEESGMTDEALDGFYEGLREKSRNEKQAGRA